MKTNKKSAKSFFQSDVDNYKKEFYESGYRTFMSVRLDRFLKEVDNLNLTENVTCLDAGCGPGYLTKALYDRNFKVTAFDSSQEMLRLTHELLSIKSGRNGYPELIKGDIENLPFDDNSFDLVASAGVLEYLPTDDKILSEFYRVLNPGSCMILSSTNKISPAGYFEPIIEVIKRNKITRSTCNLVLNKLGGTPIRARNFSVRKHTARQLALNVQKKGFSIEKIGYFYALPFPHPFDRIFPLVSNTMGRWFEYLHGSPMKYLFEGIYIVAVKPEK